MQSPNNFKTSFLGREQLPLVIEPQDKNISIKEYLKELRDNHAYLVKCLLHYGGILFRNFPVENEDAFSEVIKALDLGKFLNYIGGDSPRIKVREGIYTSTEAPPWVKIPLHNELSFVKKYPKHIYFYCATPSPVGGETIIADARKVYRSMDPSILQRFVQKGLKYTSCYYYESALINLFEQLKRSHKTWLDVFETEDKAEVERLCRENEFGYRWTKNDWIEISQVRPSILEHPLTNEKVWFNQAHMFDFSPKFLGWWRYLAVKLIYFRKYTRLHEVSFADGTKIPRKELYHIMDKLDANTIYFPWQKGDVMVLDNVLAMHGRAPFSGKRRVLVSLTG